MWMGMDMDQVWLIFFIINFFSALEGVEIAFFFPFFGLGEKVLNAVVGWTCSLFCSYPDGCCCWYA